MEKPHERLRAIGIFAILSSALYAVVGWWFPPPWWTQQTDRLFTHIPWIDSDRYWSWDEPVLTGDSIYGAPEYRVTLHSPFLRIDTLYPSMTGPMSVHYFQLAEAGVDSRAWVTRYEVEVKGDQLPPGTEAEWMCHHNLDYSLQQYYEGYGLKNRAEVQTSRLFTLSQGQTEFKFPKGFGLPLESDLSLSATAQVLNHNVPEIDMKVQQDITFHFVKEADLQKRLKPLYQQSLALLVEIEPEKEGMLDSNITKCLPAEAARPHLLETKDGRTLAGHWIIPPGKDEQSYPVTSILQLPFETRLHAVGVHLHPYASAIELRDLTLDSTIYRAEAASFTNRIGLEKVDWMEDPEGIPLYPDHEYGLYYTAHNTSGRSQDMMAVLLLYLYDPQLDEVLIKRESGADQSSSATTSLTSGIMR